MYLIRNLDWDRARGTRATCTQYLNYGFERRKGEREREKENGREKNNVLPAPPPPLCAVDRNEPFLVAACIKKYYSNFAFGAEEKPNSDNYIPFHRIGLVGLCFCLEAPATLSVRLSALFRPKAWLFNCMVKR